MGLRRGKTVGRATCVWATTAGLQPAIPEQLFKFGSAISRSLEKLTPGSRPRHHAEGADSFVRRWVRASQPGIRSSTAAILFCECSADILSSPPRLLKVCPSRTVGGIALLPGPRILALPLPPVEGFLALLLRRAPAGCEIPTLRSSEKLTWFRFCVALVCHRCAAPRPSRAPCMPAVRARDATRRHHPLPVR